MLDRGVWGNALPSHTHTITSCLLRFLPSVANPSKMGQSHTLPLFLPYFWDDATLIFRPFDLFLWRTNNYT